MAHRLNLPEGDVIREFAAWKKGRGSTGRIRNRKRVFRNNRKRKEKQDNRQIEQRLLAKMVTEPGLFERVKKN